MLPKRGELHFITQLKSLLILFKIQHPFVCFVFILKLYKVAGHLYAAVQLSGVCGSMWWAAGAGVWVAVGGWGPGCGRQRVVGGWGRGVGGKGRLGPGCGRLGPGCGRLYNL